VLFGAGAPPHSPSKALLSHLQTWERLERSIEYEAMIVGVKQRLVYTYEVYKLSDAYIEQALSKMYTARPFTEVIGMAECITKSA
jgi:hypothetical protein